MAVNIFGFEWREVLFVCVACLFVVVGGGCCCWWWWWCSCFMSLIKQNFITKGRATHLKVDVFPFESIFLATTGRP